MTVPSTRPSARTVLSGLIAPGDVTFPERKPIAGPRRRRGEFEATYAVADARGSQVRFLLDDVEVTFAGSTFNDCTFEQKKTWFAAGAFGSTSARSTYRRCRFTGVDFGVRGFSPGWARFEDCTFERCRADHFYSVRADFVGCRFVGRVNDAQFLGADPATGIPNEIRDNDFTGAQLGRVSFQAGAQPERQHWPANVIVEGDTSSWEMIVTSGIAPA